MWGWDRFILACRFNFLASAELPLSYIFLVCEVPCPLYPFYWPVWVPYPHHPIFTLQLHRTGLLILAAFGFPHIVWNQLVRSAKCPARILTEIIYIHWECSFISNTQSPSSWTSYVSIAAVALLCFPASELRVFQRVDFPSADFTASSSPSLPHFLSFLPKFFLFFPTF